MSIVARLRGPTWPAADPGHRVAGHHAPARPRGTPARRRARRRSRSRRRAPAPARRRRASAARRPRRRSSRAVARSRPAICTSLAPRAGRRAAPARGARRSVSAIASDAGDEQRQRRSTATPSAGSRAPGGGQTSARIATWMWAKASEAKIVRSTTTRISVAHHECERGRWRRPAGGRRWPPRPSDAAAARSVCHSQTIVAATATMPKAKAGSQPLHRQQQEEAGGADAGDERPPAVAGEEQQVHRPRPARMGDQRLAAAEARARQPVRAGGDLVGQAGPAPQRLARVDLRDAAHAVVLGRQPLERAGPPRVVVRPLAAEPDAQRVDEEQHDAGGEHRGAERRQQVPAGPSRGRPVGVDAPRHAQQAGDVHREERQVEAAEHQAEHPAADPLRQHVALEQRRPVVERREHREDQAADQHVVQVGDDEVGVVDLPVERQHRDHHAGQAAEHEDEEEAEQEQAGGIDDAAGRGPASPSRRRPARRSARRSPGWRPRPASSLQAPSPAVNMWCAQTREAEHADADQRRRRPRGSRPAAAARARDHHRHQAGRRQEMM